MVLINGIDYLVTSLEKQLQKRVNVLESITTNVIVQTQAFSESYTLELYPRTNEELMRLLDALRGHKEIIVDVGDSYFFAVAKQLTLNEQSVDKRVSLSLIGVPGWGTTIINKWGVAEPKLSGIYGGAGSYLVPYNGGTQYLIDWNNKFYEYVFELTNTAYEHSPTILSDDTQTTFWTVTSSGTGSLALSTSDVSSPKESGSDSMKIEISSGTAANVGISHAYTTAQDWSGYDFLSFWLYGGGTGLPIYIYILTPDWLNYGEWIIHDSFTGWRHVVLPLRKPDIITGTYDITNVNEIDIFVQESDGWSAGNALFLDRVVLDVGEWVYLEVMTPDKLQHYPASSDGVHYSKYELSSYNPSDALWHTWHTHNGTDVVDDTTALYTLSGHTYSQIYGDGAVSYEQGNAGNTAGKARVADIVGADTTITYTTMYGTQKRIGLALKLAPASDINEIDALRIRLRVYYEDGITSTSI